MVKQPGDEEEEEDVENPQDIELKDKDQDQMDHKEGSRKSKKMEEDQGKRKSGSKDKVKLNENNNKKENGKVKTESSSKTHKAITEKTSIPHGAKTLNLKQKANVEHDADVVMPLQPARSEQ